MPVPDKIIKVGDKYAVCFGEQKLSQVQAWIEKKRNSTLSLTIFADNSSLFTLSLS